MLITGMNREERLFRSATSARTSVRAMRYACRQATPDLQMLRLQSHTLDSDPTSSFSGTHDNLTRRGRRNRHRHRSKISREHARFVDRMSRPALWPAPCWNCDAAGTLPWTQPRRQRISYIVCARHGPVCTSITRTNFLCIKLSTITALLPSSNQHARNRRLAPVWAFVGPPDPPRYRLQRRRACGECTSNGRQQYDGGYRAGRSWPRQLQRRLGTSFSGA